MRKPVLAVSLFGLAILLPVIRSVNQSTTKSFSQPATFSSDGAPMPPPIPHTNTGSLLSADGAPMPPPIPHGILAGERSASVLIADGAPMPPPIPHTGNGLAA